MKFYAKELQYLFRHSINVTSIHLTEDKVQAIKDSSIPEM